jgi:hypothetical protein
VRCGDIVEDGCWDVKNTICTLVLTADGADGTYGTYGAYDVTNLSTQTVNEYEGPAGPESYIPPCKQTYVATAGSARDRKSLSLDM